jgi:hypothetical protein
MVVQHRRAAVGIDFEKLRRAAFALYKKEIEELAGDYKLRE